MRGWHESVAVVGDWVPGGVPALGLLLLGLTAVVAVLWYWWPQWLPGAAGRVGARSARDRGGGRDRRRSRPRRPRSGLRRRRWRLRWGRWRLRWRRPRRRHRDGGHADLPPEVLPELAPVAPALSADELAAQGRYREAVRERLRGIVHELVAREVVAYRPGWTVTELAGTAGAARPAAAEALAAATEIFSRIWYGQREALACHDAAMRGHAATVRAALSSGAREQVAG